MTDIQIVSDLHIEHKNNAFVNPFSLIVPTANILVLAGDIGSLYQYEQLRDFLTKLCPKFKMVIYVPGNCEYYRIQEIRPESMGVLFERILRISNNIPNLHILDRSSIRVGNVCIAGATLWSRLDTQIPKYIVRIHGISTERYTTAFENDLHYIQTMINHCHQKQLKLVVVTHYAPTYRALDGARKKKRLQSLYASHLDHLLSSDKVHTWICGHVHRNFDFVTDGGTRVVGNQLGKPKDQIVDYRPNFVLHI